MLISAIVTVRNESRNIRDLLDSLVVQEQPFEVVVVDSYSDDDTRKIVKEYSKDHPFVRLFKKGGTRGQGRNFGVEQARGEAVAFIDGDCVAAPDWIHEMREGLKDADVVAGTTINMGFHPFADLGRVELFYKGVDLTFPSCNLTYRKDLFQDLGGFDTVFITAEDIDLNYRAVEGGAVLVYRESAFVKHKAREDFFGFSKQAFWNGYGRKQLTLKHGSLWGNYKPHILLGHRATFWYMLRIGLALLGYFVAKFKEARRDELDAKLTKKYFKKG
jgi:glycosyltransferase involved in cell wall biosynthesis